MTLGLKVVFVLIAALCAFAVLVGIPADADQVKVIAAGLLAAAVAIVVP